MPGCRYLLQQGYGGREQPDICILTPYVGQLLKLRQAVASMSGLKFVMSERDRTDLAHVVTDTLTADSAFDTGDGNTADGSSSTVSHGVSDTTEQGGSSSSSSSGSSSGIDSTSSAALLAGAGSKVVTMGRSIRLATIDNFQGEEARIIILSLVRNPREEGAGIGFLAVNNRINVLLSRWVLLSRFKPTGL
jgi:hypothetical protein